MNETLLFVLFFFVNAGAGNKVALDYFPLRFTQGAATSLSRRLHLYHVDTGNFMLAVV